jgi:hypothetical protein
VALDDGGHLALLIEGHDLSERVVGVAQDE